jgi:hypothetical protein
MSADINIPDSYYASQTEIAVKPSLFFKKDVILNHILKSKDPIIPEVGHATELAEKAYRVQANLKQSISAIDWVREDPSRLIKLNDLFLNIHEMPVWVSGKLGRGRFGAVMTMNYEEETPENIYLSAWWMINKKIVFIPAIAVLGKSLKQVPENMPTDVPSTNISIWATPGTKKLVQIAQMDQKENIYEDIEKQFAIAIFLIAMSAAGHVAKQAANGTMWSFFNPLV